MYQAPHSAAQGDAMPVRRFLCVEQAAAYLGISKSLLDKMRGRGDGPPYIKVARRVVYDLADLDDFALRHRRQSTSERTIPPT